MNHYNLKITKFLLKIKLKKMFLKLYLTYIIQVLSNFLKHSNNTTTQ